MKKELGYRVWFYFRMGWTTYFAFIFAAVNTIVVTYYLAISNVSVLKEVFPSFLSYSVTMIAIGIPLLIIIGYVHFKRSGAFKAEADINIESNPHLKRILMNTEVLFPLYLKMSDILVKLSKNEKLSEKEIEDITNLQKELSEHMKKHTMK
jgi:hypothetical protein